MADGRSSEGTDIDIILRLPEANRDAFKEPLGPIYTDVDALLGVSGDPIIAVGDVVVATLLEAEITPAVAIVDGQTKRAPVDADVLDLHDTIEPAITCVNPPATLTRSLLVAIAEAMSMTTPVKIVVDGEEDLAVIPAILAAPPGATVVYGQPDEGMVAVEVTDEVVAQITSKLRFLEGSTEELWDVLT